jgi:hypothetical protein
MTIQVRVANKAKVRATVASGVIMARTLEELLDVDVAGVQDNYVIMYSASTQKYTAVNPDDILTSAVTDVNSPGIPGQFINALDTDLNREDNIDIDAGTF